MLRIQSFTFNLFAENTYLVWDDVSMDCAIFDPGCSNHHEEKIVDDFILQNNLKLTQLINTHCHIDHVLGNHHISNKYNLNLQAHQLEKSVLEWSQSAAMLYQIPYTPYNHINILLSESDSIKIGEHILEIRFTPGHSPGSLTFVSHSHHWALVGDVIFYQSIGRTDLPGGDYQTLENSIRQKIYTLPNHFILYSGHGESTEVGFEKKHNGFVRL